MGYSATQCCNSSFGGLIMGYKQQISYVAVNICTDEPISKIVAGQKNVRRPSRAGGHAEA
jgi:hypothetical protein